MPDSDLLSQLAAFVSVVLIDVVLAGDNAVVVGTAASGLPPKEQRHVIMVGSALALVARIAFALIATKLLAIIGLTLAGGLLLLWVAWKIWRELRRGHDEEHAHAAASRKPKSFGSAVIQVAVADISMSLDNVLAIAGAAHAHPWIMVFGLVLSIGLMAVAAGIIARMIDRYRWIAYVGLAIVLAVAGKMIWEGWHEVANAVATSG
jgi:YjbE family integral membrane protein